MPPVPAKDELAGAQNAKVKALRRALSHAELVDGMCALDSPHLLAEAARSGLSIPTVFVAASQRTRVDDFGQIETLSLSEKLFRSIVSVDAPQGIAALVVAPTWDIDAVLREQRGLAIVAASIQDPGNLGTLIRSAEAFGATCVITLKGTVSLWNPKVLRASAGSAFRLPVLALDDVTDLHRFGYTLLAADSQRGEIAFAADLKRKTAIVIGNEGSGPAKTVLDACDGFIRIPHLETVESLNAGVAASLLLYEAFRQRHYKDQ